MLSQTLTITLAKRTEKMERHMIAEERMKEHAAKPNLWSDLRVPGPAYF